MNSSVPIKSGGTVELRLRKDGNIDLYAGRELGPPIHADVVQPTREELGYLRNVIDRILGSSRKITEHEMLVTLATMAIKMDDLTGHDVVEALRAHGYAEMVAEARGVPMGKRRIGRGLSATARERANRTRKKSTFHGRVAATTAEIVGAWRKCQLSFVVPQDAIVTGHELDASEGASILSLDLIEPGHLLLANQTYTVRIANGRLPQHVSLTLILEKR